MKSAIRYKLSHSSSIQINTRRWWRNSTIAPPTFSKIRNNGMLPFGKRGA